MPCRKRGLISYLCTVSPVEFPGGAPLFLFFEDWEVLGSRFVVESFSITSYSEIQISGKVVSTGAFAERHQWVSFSWAGVLCSSLAS